MNQNPMIKFNQHQQKLATRSILHTCSDQDQESVAPTPGERLRVNPVVNTGKLGILEVNLLWVAPYGIPHVNHKVNSNPVLVQPVLRAVLSIAGKSAMFSPGH